MDCKASTIKRWWYVEIIEWEQNVEHQYGPKRFKDDISLADEKTW